MAAWAGPPRIALYSHDTYGLGHLTRSTRIAAAVSRALPGASVLILTGSPIAHHFRFPSGVDYVKLPSVIKRGPERYQSLELAVSPRRVTRMRSEIITDTLGTFQPNLLLVDNVPLGMKGELLPALEQQRARNRDVQIHLNLRDVLDDPAVIEEQWQGLGIPAVLEHVYDAINVFGSASVYDSVAAYGLPAEKTEMLGYIRAGVCAGPAPSPLAGRKRVLVTIGGGGDGESVLRTAVEMQRGLGKESPYDLRLVPGPFMHEDGRTRLARACEGLGGVTLHDFVDDLPKQMLNADVVLSMGGYNTMCEVMTVGRPSIVVPRTYPRREQEIRARALERLGVTRVVHPDELTPRVLRDTLEAVSGDRDVPSACMPSLDGLSRFTERLWRLYGRRAMNGSSTTALSRVYPAPAGEGQSTRSHSHSSPVRRRLLP